jgi:hypothetical protein
MHTRLLAARSSCAETESLLRFAVAIGDRAIEIGFETLCTTAAELIEDLSNACAKGLLQ